jgi:hypothetical protein
MLVAVALVMGSFYLWDGARRFVSSGGLGVAESTQRAQLVATSTAERGTRVVITRTPPSTPTPLPTCEDFRVEVVDAPNAIVRELPSRTAAVIDAWPSGTMVCVLGQDSGSEFYTIDLNPETRRLELAYMHESVLEPVNPTATPTVTFTPPPTVTPVPTATFSSASSAAPTPSAESAQPTMPPGG